MNSKQAAVSRRSILRWGTWGTLGAIAGIGGWFNVTTAARAESSTESPLTPDEAFQRLMDGNQRFVERRPIYPDQTVERLQAIAQGQHPFATILSCADSRVPAELLFDQGFGDLFDVRVAGNIVTPEILGSVEYAVEHLAAPLLMVLGHERCGAVTAAVNPGEFLGSIGTFVEAILPAVERVEDQPGDPVDNAVISNVYYQMEQLQRSPLVAERLESGQLKLVGGRYDLDTGTVTILSA